MKFFLPFPIQSLAHKIQYGDRIMMIGSCFSTEIGERLAAFKFNVFQNPTGIVYHSEVIAEVIERCIGNKKFENSDLFENNGLFHSWLHHSVYSGADTKSTLQRMNDQLQCAHDFLKKGDYLIITPATAFGYFSKENNRIVANCHKMPGNFFEKRLSNEAQIHQTIKATVNKVRDFNPKIKIIFTISPVKHYRDGIVENTISKAHVISAVQKAITEIKDVSYFPSYEILNDELRDYRFFKNDFAHPNETAVSYIFQRFLDFALDEKTRGLMERVGEVTSAFQHKLLFPQSEGTKAFAKQQLKKINDLKTEFPFLNFEKEIEQFEQF